MSLLLKGVTKLSELTIDAAKDWQGFGISNIGTVVVTDGAGHYFELPSLTTAQRDDLTPSVGMTIWNSDNARVEKYNGASWTAIGIAGVAIRKDSGAVIGTRPQLNIKTGVGMGLIVEDNPADDEVDITYSSATPHKHMILLPEDAILPTANPAEKATTDGTNFSYETLDFDHTTEESAFWERWLTPDYNEENIIAEIFWISAAASGDAKFGFQVLGRAEGETWDSALGTEQTVVSPTGGAGVLNRAVITTFKPNWMGEDILVFKLARKAGDAADTIDANDVRVVKVVVSYTVTFKQAFYPLAAPAELDETDWVDGSYYTVDAKDYGVPHGATGVMLHFDVTSGEDIAVRKKGSTDDIYDHMNSSMQAYAYAGLNSHDEFEIKTGGKASMVVYIIGYTGTGVVFFDNYYSKAQGSSDNWADIDVSTECPSAIGIIVRFQNPYVSDYENHLVGVRKNGSTSDYTGNIIYKAFAFGVVGCDGSQLFEYWRDHANTENIYIVGYILDGATLLTTKVDKTPAGTGSWEERDVSGYAKINIAFVEFTHIMVNDASGFRKGTTGGIYKDMIHQTVPVMVDQNGKYQAIREYASVGEIKHYLTGYATHAG